MRAFGVNAIVTMIALATPCFALAQDYPARPIRIIVPNTPGTQADSVPRIVAPDLAKILGQPVLVENKPGADGAIAYEYVAKQMPPDGYTTVMVTDTTLASLLVTAKDLRFDPVKDLPPVIGFVESRAALFTPAKAPWASLTEFISAAKANPNKYNYGLTSFSWKINMQAILKANDLSVVEVPYNGTGALTAALAAGEVQLGGGGLQFDPTLIRLIGVSGQVRHPTFPGVPTFAEYGFPSIPGVGSSLHVARGTPQPIVDKLYAAARKVMEIPDVRERLARLNVDLTDWSPEQVQKKVEVTAAHFVNTAKAIGLQ